MHLERIRFFVSFAVLQILIDLVNIEATKSVTITVEGRFGYETTAQFNTFGIERFDNLVDGLNPRYQSTFGMGEQSPITGTYFDLEVAPADMYGGATGSGRYAVARSNTFYALRLDKPADFFGLWVSDADDSNIVRFFHHDEKVFEYYVKNVLEGLGARRRVYLGNPRGVRFFATRSNIDREYLFINAFFTGGIVYDYVQFVQGNGGHFFESDNHTVGNWTVTSGTHAITGTVITPTTTSTTTRTTSTRIGVVKSVTITVEDRFTYESTAQFNTSGIERFDNLVGQKTQRYQSTFGMGEQSPITWYQSTFGMGEQSPITGTYFYLKTARTDNHGGAPPRGATTRGRFAVALNDTFYALRLNKPADFFGLWVSHADDFSIVRFFHHDEMVFEYYVKNVLEGLGASRQEYKGNLKDIHFLGPHSNNAEFLFINTFFTGIVYDYVQFVQGIAGSFESDNHTVGNWTVTSGRHALPTTTSTTTTTTSTTTTTTSTTTTTTSTTTTTTSTTTTTTSTTTTTTSTTTTTTSTTTTTTSTTRE